MNKKTYTGINIQWPISQDIISGKKIIETRTYPIPPHYLNEEMLLIETPGRAQKFKSRIIAIIQFIECFQYPNALAFYKDFSAHLVNPESPWAYRDKGKWGWRISLVEIISPPVQFLGKKGIVYSFTISW